MTIAISVEPEDVAPLLVGLLMGSLRRAYEDLYALSNLGPDPSRAELLGLAQQGVDDVLGALPRSSAIRRRLESMRDELALEAIGSRGSGESS